MTLITIALCIWAIVLELHLRKRERANHALVVAINAVALGKAKITRRNEQTVIIYNPQRGAN